MLPVLRSLTVLLLRIWVPALELAADDGGRWRAKRHIFESSGPRSPRSLVLSAVT